MKIAIEAASLGEFTTMHGKMASFVLGSLGLICCSEETCAVLTRPMPLAGIYRSGQGNAHSPPEQGFIALKHEHGCAHRDRQASDAGEQHWRLPFSRMAAKEQVLIAMEASHKLLVGKEMWQRSASRPKIAETSRTERGFAQLPLARANKARVAAGPSFAGALQHS